MAIKFEFDLNFGPKGKPRELSQSQTVEALKKSMQRQALGFVGKVQTRRLSGRPGLIPRSPGMGLRRALNTVTYGKDIQSVESRIGWPKPFFWVKVHEDGAVIQAKRKFLAIPFPGTTGATKRRGSVSGLRPSDFPRDKTFFARGKNTKPGNMILFEKLGNGAIRPLFIMTPRISIPARLGYFNLYDKEKASMAKAIMDEMHLRFGGQWGAQ